MLLAKERWSSHKKTLAQPREGKNHFLIAGGIISGIMAALIFVPLWLSSIENDEQQHVAVIPRDNTSRR